MLAHINQDQILFSPGSVLESGQEMHLSKHTDLSSLKATFRSLIIAHYPSLQDRVAFRLVSCPFVCANTLNLLAR